MMAKVGTLVSALLLALSLTSCPAVSPSVMSQPEKTDETDSAQKTAPVIPSDSPKTEYQSPSEQEQSMSSTDDESAPTDNITMKINGEEFALALADNKTAQAFADLLPLEAEFSELNGNEKYLYIDQPLPNSGSIVPEIEAGDVMLYGDSCIVIFYKTHGNSAYSYTPIGKISDAGTLASVVGTGVVEVQILP